MKIEFITNASFLITLKDGRKILTDPWFFDGIYYGGWANFPPLDDKLRDRYLQCHPDYIYISHLHPDHLDIRTLKYFAKSTPILIGAYPTPELKNIIRNEGFIDIREYTFGEIVPLDGIEISILKQFEGTGDGYLSEVEYLMDSSLWIRDVDGQTVLNINDNPIKPSDALDILKKYGHPDCAFLPCSGASSFPFAFPQYSPEEKETRRDILTTKRLSSFTQIADILQPRWTIPTAGAYVNNACLAKHSQYLHQATPDEIQVHWQGHPASAHSKLLVMMPGDQLDLSRGEINAPVGHPYRHHTRQDRDDYSYTLANRPLPQQQILIPDAFSVPLLNLMHKARRNLWRFQKRSGSVPNEHVELVIRETSGIPTLEKSIVRFNFNLGEESVPPIATTEQAPKIRFTMDSSIMLMILISGANWNNAEIAGLIEIERWPDMHKPTLHTLMNHFHL